MGNQQRCQVAVIGAGPAGIMAALEAARCGAEVALYDTNDAPGRKLLVTGNGRCNISHVGARACDYVSDCPAALEAILSRCGHPQVIACLEELGILTYATPDGWCYPLSDSAVTVVDTLTVALQLAGVRWCPRTQVRDLRGGPDGWMVIAGDAAKSRLYDRVVVATGGKAHPALGSTGQFFDVLRQLGHHILPIHPALVSIEADMRRLHKLQGVRLDAGLSLYAADALLGRTVGNLMFTQSGLSGPAAMNLSHLVHASEGGPLTAAIDLLALHGQALERLLQSRRGEPWPLKTVLGAVLPAKVPPVLLSLAGLPADVRLNSLNEAAVDAVLALARNLTVRVTGTRDYAFAQVSTGGVPLAEIDAGTLQSHLVPGLFLAGEVLNAFGPCGGYNLLLAQATGILAGRGAASAI